MAIAMDLPILIVRSGIGDAGVFGMGHDSSTLTTLDVDEYGPVSSFDEAVAQWLRTLTSF